MLNIDFIVPAKLLRSVLISAIFFFKLDKSPI